jgi:hypothetical protein
MQMSFQAYRRIVIILEAIKRIAFGNAPACSGDDKA